MSSEENIESVKCAMRICRKVFERGTDGEREVIASLVLDAANDMVASFLCTRGLRAESSGPKP